MHNILDPSNLVAPALGERTIDSPLDRQMAEADPDHAFYGDDNRVLVDHMLPEVQEMIRENREFPCFEVAGPRRKIFFDP